MIEAERRAKHLHRAYRWHVRCTIVHSEMEKTMASGSRAAHAEESRPRDAAEAPRRSGDDETASKPSAWELVKSIGRESIEDDVPGAAAKSAYYFALSLFPAILALFAFTGIFGGQAAFDWIMGRLNAVLPGEASTYLQRFVQEITGQQRPGMLSIGILLTLWSASNIFAILTEVLNGVYDIEESRSWWKKRAIAVGALVVSLVLFIAGAAALLAGPAVVSALELDWAWTIVRWPLALFLIAVMMAFIYYWLPNRSQRGTIRFTFIGAVVGTTLWALGTAGFRVYVSHFGTYSKTYGFVGGIILLLMWLYLTSFSILVGGEVAATLEQNDRRGSKA